MSEETKNEQQAELQDEVTQNEEVRVPETSDEKLTDSHGQEAVAKGKYQRDIANKDAEIEALRKELEEVKGEASKSADANEEIRKLRAEIADEKLTNALNAQGCINPKAAKALLEDYDNDIDALAKDCPYLFKQKQTGTTGGAPNDAATHKERVDKARAAVGLKPKE